MTHPPIIFVQIESGGYDPLKHAFLGVHLAILDSKGETLVARQTFLALPEAKLVTPEAVAINGYTEESWLTRGAKPLAEVREQVNAWRAANKVSSADLVALSVANTMRWLPSALPDLAKVFDASKCDLSQMARDFYTRKHPEVSKPPAGTFTRAAIVQRDGVANPDPLLELLSLIQRYLGAGLRPFA